MWITYDTLNNEVLCEVCSAADKMHAPLPCTGGREMDSYKAFVKEGFCSWGKAIEIESNLRQLLNLRAQHRTTVLACS